MSRNRSKHRRHHSQSLTSSSRKSPSIIGSSSGNVCKGASSVLKPSVDHLISKYDALIVQHQLLHPTVASLCSELCDYFRAIIVSDPLNSLNRHLSHFWDGVVFRTIISFQDLISQQASATAQSDHVPPPNFSNITLEHHFRSFLRQGIGLFHHLLANVALRYRLPRPVVDIYYVDPPHHLKPLMSTSRLESVDADRGASLLIYFRILVYLGMLVQANQSPHRSRSSSFYFKRALDIVPDNGTPWFLLACSDQRSILVTVSMFVRSLLTAVPNPNARSELGRTLSDLVLHSNSTLDTSACCPPTHSILLPLAYVYLGQYNNVSEDPDILDQWSSMCLLHLDGAELMGLMIILIGYQTIGLVLDSNLDSKASRMLNHCVSDNGGSNLVQLLLGSLIRRLIKSVIDCVEHPAFTHESYLHSPDTQLSIDLFSFFDKVSAPLRTALLVFGKYSLNDDLSCSMRALSRTILDSPMVIKMVLSTPGSSMPSSFLPQEDSQRSSSNFHKCQVLHVIKQLPNVALPDDLIDLVGLCPFTSYLRSIVPAIVAIDDDCMQFYNEYGFRGFKSMMALHEARLASKNLGDGVVRIGRLVSIWQATARVFSRLLDSQTRQQSDSLKTKEPCLATSLVIEPKLNGPDQEVGTVRSMHIAPKGMHNFGLLATKHNTNINSSNSTYSNDVMTPYKPDQSTSNVWPRPFQSTADVMPAMLNEFEPNSSFLTLTPPVAPVRPLRLPAWSKDGLFENDEFDPTISLPIENLSVAPTPSNYWLSPPPATANYEMPAPHLWQPSKALSTQSPNFPNICSSANGAQPFATWSGSSISQWNSCSLTECAIPLAPLLNQSGQSLSQSSLELKSRNIKHGLLKNGLRPFSPLPPPSSSDCSVAPSAATDMSSMQQGTELSSNWWSLSPGRGHSQLGSHWTRGLGLNYKSDSIPLTSNSNLPGMSPKSTNGDI